MSQDEVEARKKSAERGWLADPPPPPPRPYIPGEEHKWRLMMGARYLIETDEKRRPRQEALSDTSDSVEVNDRHEGGT